MSNADATLIGNITRDPELRFTASGMPTCKFGIAVNHRRQNRQTGDWDETTSFFNVVCFQQLAENVADSLQKGARVIVTGRLEVSEWQTQEGEKRNSVDLIADEIGPSLRWATAQISKTDRRGPADGASFGAPQAAPARSAPAAGGGEWNEEPF